MRDDIDRFTEVGAGVVAIAPDTPEGVAGFLKERDFPFPLLADPSHEVFDGYDVISTMMSLGQRPALFVIDRHGVVQFDSIGTQQWQIPTNDNVLKLLADLRGAG